MRRPVVRAGPAAALALLAATAGLPGPPAGAATASPGGPSAAAAADGPWAWPLDDAGPAPVVRSFDPPQTRYSAGHRGVDLAGVPGQAVRSAGAGRVSYAGLLAGRGVVVVVHGGLRTTYEPVTASVAVGAAVAAGEPLGTLAPGHLGCAATACLHWGLRRGETYLDPLRLLTGGPVRLLPLHAPRQAPPARGPGVAGRPAEVADPGLADGPALRRVSATGRSPAGVAAGATAGLAVLLLALALLRTLPRPRPRPGGSAAAGAGPAVPVDDELARRRPARGRTPAAAPGRRADRGLAA